MLIFNDLKFEKTNQRVLRLANVFISVFTMLALVAFTTSTTVTYSTKARITEALFHFPAAREKIMSDFSYSGIWPEKRILQEYDKNLSNYIAKITFDGIGSIHFLFNNETSELSGKILSFVASNSIAKTSDKIIWNCGFTEPVFGFTSIGENQTTVEEKYLPISCRSSDQIN